ncbi:hypothetical protein [Streptomyces griseofuscus]|uniref:hypothetical protein n=1 Tax=Streptomyces griseofuscus TaxID=146922 RepID=UPI0033F8B992
MESIEQFVHEVVGLTRTIVAGHRQPGDAQRLIEQSYRLAHRRNPDWRPRQRGLRYEAPAAIALMRRVGLGALVVHADGVRAALNERPSMAPDLYLRSLRLGTLPAWPLPDDGDTQVMVYSLRFVCAGLWEAVVNDDGAELDRAVARLLWTPSGISARHLGD